MTIIYKFTSELGKEKSSIICKMNKDKEKQERFLGVGCIVFRDVKTDFFCKPVFGC